MRYTHSGLRTDDMLAMDVTSEGVSAGIANEEGSFFYTKDGLGSVIDVTSSTGLKVQHYALSAFGKLLKVEDGNGNDITANQAINKAYSFTGRELDDETGLNYYRARYYDPSTGRFTQEDPHPGILSMPTSFVSPYRYTLNNPTRFTDPEGRIVPILLAAAFIGGVANSYFNRHNGQNFFLNFGVGAVLGASSAAVGIGIGFAVSSLLSGMTGAVIGGAAGGASSSMFSQYISSGRINWGHVGLGEALGGISGAIGYGLSQGTSSSAMNNSTEFIDTANKSAVQSIIENTNGSAGSGASQAIIPPSTPNYNPPLPGPIYIPDPM